MDSICGIKRLEAKLVSPLLSHTILWPFGLGIGFASILFAIGPRPLFLGFIAMAMILAIYLLLEGLPAFPPVAAKQKLSYVIVGIAFIAVFTYCLRLNAEFMTVAMLSVVLAWLGYSKLFVMSAWPQSLAILAPIAASAFASRNFETRGNEVFLWPATFLVFAVGGSFLSLLGVFVGFAQAMGAMAAWLGGFLVFQFVSVAAGRKVNALPAVVSRVVLLSFVSISFMVALFAPDINLAAFAILSLTLVVPQFAPKFGGLSAIARPFVFGFLAAVPAVTAILVAFLQRGVSAG
jgi:hypothetical protein